MNLRARLKGHFQPLSVALLYGVLASLWIVLSDRAVGWLFKDPAVVLLASTAKGWLFVGVTTALVFVLLLRRERRAPDTPAPVRDLPWWGLAGLLVLVLAATGLAINGVWRTEREQVGKQLLAISESKAREIATWHAERLHDARWLQADKDLQVNWLIWQHSQAVGALQALGQRLAGQLNDGHFRRVSLLRPDGSVVWHSAGPTHGSDPELLAGLRQALQTDSPVRVAPGPMPAASSGWRLSRPCWPTATRPRWRCCTWTRPSSCIRRWPPGLCRRKRPRPCCSAARATTCASCRRAGSARREAQNPACP